jgi:hypothetical protein
MPSLADAETTFYKTATGLTIGSIHDLEHAYYSSLSGLTPVAKYSLQDHQRVYWEAQTGLTKCSLSQLEGAFLDLQGISTGSLDNRRLAYFSGGGSPGVSGTLSATLPMITASFGGVLTRVGILSATLPMITASFSGTTAASLTSPFVNAGSASTSGVSTTSFTLDWDLITDKQTDDLIIFFWLGINTAVYTIPSGLTEYNRNTDGSFQQIALKRKIDGTEGTGNITFTSDVGQRHTIGWLHYRGVSDTFNDFDQILETGSVTSPMSHDAGTSTPVVDDAFIVAVYAERTGTTNDVATLTPPTGYTIRAEHENAGSGGTFICMADDGGVVERTAGAVSPSDWSCPIGSGTAIMTIIALERSPFDPPPTTTKPLMGASASNNTNFNTLNTAAGPFGCRRIFLGNITASTTFQNSALSQEAGTGRVVYASWKPANMATFATDTTAQGNFSNFLDTIPQDVSIVFFLWHEPEDNINGGEFTLAQWKANVYKCGDLIAAKNRPLIRNGWCIMGAWTFDNRSAYNAYDMDTWDTSKFQVIGIDPYVENANDPAFSTILTVNNSGTSGPGTSDSVLTHISVHNKPICIAEWGVTETNKTLTQKATEITNFYNWVRDTWNPAHPNSIIEGMCYFNNNLDVPSDPDRTWELHDAPLDAFIAACADSRN